MVELARQGTQLLLPCSVPTSGDESFVILSYCVLCLEGLTIADLEEGIASQAAVVIETGLAGVGNHLHWREHRELNRPIKGLNFCCGEHVAWVYLRCC